MRFSDLFRKRVAMLTVMLTVVLIFGGGIAWCASGGGEHGGGGHGDEAAHKGWVSTDTFRVMNFTVLAIVLVLLLRKPLAQGLNSRIQGIKEQLSDLEAKKQQAEQELTIYTEKIAQLDQEAEKIVAEYIRQGNEAKKRILQEAESAADKLQEQAKRSIENEFKRAKQQLQTEVIEQALAKAEENIKSKISDKDQEQLVDEYLAKVVA
jgi:F-type H+-transporting ATPase subunit b